MRFALPKNRTAPLIILAAFGILVSLSLGLYHINRMVQYSYKSQYEEYSCIANNSAALLQQEIDQTYQSLLASADYISKEETLDKNTISSLLTLMNSEGIFADMAIVNQNGVGFNIGGEELNVSKEEYFQNIENGSSFLSDHLNYLNDTPILTYAIPVMKNGRIRGAIIAEAYAEFCNIPLLNQYVLDGASVYLVNDKKEPIAYVKGTDFHNFSYSDISAVVTNQKINTSPFFSMSDIFHGIKGLGTSTMWYERALGVNRWSIVFGQDYHVNPLTKDMLRLTNVMWIIVTASILFLFSMMILIQRRSNRKVIKTLYLDPVTGGDNWYKFRINANKILNSKQSSRRKYALVNFDINRFKIINDAYGYQKGDEVLKDIYHVIKKWNKPGEPFTRYAADQFYIFMSYIEECELEERITELNDRLHELRYTKTARVQYGVYLIKERLDSLDRMGEFASIAKNNIKGNSESIISFFDDVDRGRLLEEEEIEKSMNEALKNHEFQVYLQPKYAAKEETITGAEALVRWRNSDGKPVAPSYFIPVFEKNGFITELDYYMLRKVCVLLREWLDKGYSPFPISVNISRLHFANAHLAETITEIVDSYGVPHPLIEIELTESAFLQNKQMLIDTVIRLREYGFLVSMDDFGAGYSSLNSLKDLPLDVVKLDGEMFRMTEEVERGNTVIRNTINMAKDLHIKVVAECIETKEQVEFLCMVGCDIIQGYYFAKPMPTDQFEEIYLAS